MESNIKTLTGAHVNTFATDPTAARTGPHFRIPHLTAGSLKTATDAPKTTSPSETRADKVLTFFNRWRLPTFALLQKCRHVFLSLRHSKDEQCPAAPHLSTRLFSSGTAFKYKVVLLPNTTTAIRWRYEDDTIDTTWIRPTLTISLRVIIRAMK
jgi:hypothetical protein